MVQGTANAETKVDAYVLFSIGSERVALVGSPSTVRRVDRRYSFFLSFSTRICFELYRLAGAMRYQVSFDSLWIGRRDSASHLKYVSVSIS
jgi:hypothetical protein